MALVKRADAAPPELKREIVAVEALGGDVAVTELTLSDRLDFEAVLAQTKKVSKTATVAKMVAHLLAPTVLDADDEPLFTVKQWQAFGGRHRDVTLELFNRAFRLSGFDGAENAKNS